MKKIIVTGCNGQLGRAVNQQYAGSTEYELVNTDVAELDITRVDKVLELAREVKPYAIINCAAYTNVDKCEVEQDLAYKINAIGARNLAIAAADTGAKLMHISTDYVFPGDVSCHPLTEFDPVSPRVCTAPPSWQARTLCVISQISTSLSVPHGCTGTAITSPRPC